MIGLKNTIPCFFVIAACCLSRVEGQQSLDGSFIPIPVLNPSHLVLEPPRPLKHGQIVESGIVDESVVVDQTGVAGPNNHATKPNVHLHEAVRDHFLHADKTPRPVAIDGAARTPVWKTPYSYGHFGASRTRQWSLHHGHQQSYTQWTLR